MQREYEHELVLLCVSWSVAEYGGVMRKSPERQQALRTGATTYVGTPCRRCAGTVRYTSTGTCKACNDRVAARYRTYVLNIKLDKLTCP